MPRVSSWLVTKAILFDLENYAPWIGNMTFLVEMAPPGLGNLCQVLHSGFIPRDVGDVACNKRCRAAQSFALVQKN